MNALSEVQGLVSLTVDPEGNPITVKEWRSYVIYRLAHWGLKLINGVEVIAINFFSILINRKIGERGRCSKSQRGISEFK